MLSTMINTTLYILLKNNLLTLYVGIYNYAIYLVAPYGVKSISTTAQQKEKKKKTTGVWTPSHQMYQTARK